jgi:glycosyltransferase involved in cell wall biosynthesis
MRVAHGLACALIKAGHEVTVCTTNMADETHDLRIPSGEPIEISGVRVYYEKVRFLRYWGFSPELYCRIQAKVQMADFVLIHAHYQFGNWAGAYLARKYNKPYAVFAHSSLHHVAVTHRNQWLKRLYLTILERQNLRGAKFIAFNAEEEKEQSLFSERGKIVSNGLDAKDFASLPPSGLFRLQYPELSTKTLFLFLGRLDIQQKGLDILIRAFSEASTKQPNLHLILAGPDEEEGANQLHRMVRDYGVSHRVTFTGMLSGDLKKAALQDADVFVLPSRFEGLSIALLEALYIGLPVLVTNRVGLHRTIQDLQAGVVAQPDVQSVSQALVILSNKRQLASMRGRAIQLIREKYTWDVIAKNLLQMMEPLHVT